MSEEFEQHYQSCRRLVAQLSPVDISVPCTKNSAATARVLASDCTVCLLIAKDFKAAVTQTLSLAALYTHDPSCGVTLITQRADRRWNKQSGV